MKDLLEYILTSIVTKPNKVSIKEETDGYITRLKFSVDSEDMGLVIGKEGRVIKAIQNLLKIRAIKEGKRVYVDLEEGSKTAQ